jgi:hypothetical protein
MAEECSKGDFDLKQRIIQDMHRRIENKINNNYNPLKGQLDAMNHAIMDYLRLQGEINNKTHRIQFINDPFAKQQMQLEIMNLKAQADDKIVLIHDTISSINPNIYTAKTHVIEAIEQLRRSGHNFMNSFYKYIEDFNH